MVGAWLLVRAYRAQRDLREATGDTPSRSGGAAPRRRGAVQGGAAPAQQALHAPLGAAQAHPSQARERAKSGLTVPVPGRGRALTLGRFQFTRW